MPLNVLVTGSGGQLGSELRFLAQESNEQVSKESLKGINFYFTEKANLDICDKSIVEEFCKEKIINVIINCAAYTFVDKAESEAERADAINHLAVENLAIVAKEQSIILIHISTDYVYDGEKRKPYLESDLTNPQGVYGKSKFAGEQAMQKLNPANSIIIRTSWLYSPFGNNFVKTMLRLGAGNNELNVVSDQIGSPTAARDLASAILRLIPILLSLESRNEDVKIYHYSNEGHCSWYEFAEAIFEFSSVSCKANAIPSADYPTEAVRPMYSVLDKALFTKEFEQKIPHWKISLKKLIQEFDV